MFNKRLFGFLTDSKKYIMLQVLWQWLSLVTQISMIFTSAICIDMLINGLMDNTTLVICAITFFAGIVLRYFLERLAARASYKASAGVKLTLRKMIYAKLLKLGPSYKSQVPTSKLVQMAAEGVEQLEIYFGRYLPQLFYSLLAPLTLFVVISLSVSWQAGLVLLMCVPLIPVSIALVQTVAGRLFKKYWSVYAGLGDSFLENLQGLTTLKIFQADEAKSHEMDVQAENFRKITMRVLMMQLNSTTIMDIMALGGSVAGIVVAVTQYLSGDISLGSAVMVCLLAAEFFIPMRILGSYFHIAMNGMAAAGQIFKLLDIEEPIVGSVELSTSKKGDRTICLNNVEFGYNKDSKILSGASMKLGPFGTYAIVGESGCGKSTIAALIMGRNRGYSGEILLDDHQVFNISEASLMKTAKMVGHNETLFKGTVEENLRVGNPKISEEEMKRLLDAVNLWDVFASRGGLQAPVQERAANLSGGQKQRLALARALACDSDIYIFDEATSSIDVESEEIIMDLIHKLGRTKTIIIISHSLKNIVNCNYIYMLKDGRVCQSGTHEGLLKSGGHYAIMYQAQQQLELVRTCSISGAATGRCVE